MRTHRAGVYAVALAAVLAACGDSAAAPGGVAGTGPSFAATSSATQVHFVSNGQAAYVNWYQWDPEPYSYTYGSVNVSRGGTADSAQTWLQYYVVRCDWYRCDLVGGGYGRIPNRDLSGGGDRLRLSTNTSDNPGFYVWGGAAGEVSVEWQANGLYSWSSSGTQHQTYGGDYGWTSRRQGRSTTASANATGSVVGVQIPAGSYAEMGTNHQVSIDISR